MKGREVKLASILVSRPRCREVRRVSSPIALSSSRSEPACCCSAMSTDPPTVLTQQSSQVCSRRPYKQGSCMNTTMGRIQNTQGYQPRRMLPLPLTTHIAAISICLSICRETRRVLQRQVKCSPQWIGILQKQPHITNSG